MKDRCIGLLWPIVFAVLMVGCTNASKSHISGTTPALNSIYQRAIIASVSCEFPVAASDDFSESFRYGCFCGQKHPRLPDVLATSATSESALTPEQQIERLYRITPVDDIDAACQTHDICLVHTQGDSRACNNKLHARIQSIQKDMKKKQDGENQDALAYRCQVFASNITKEFRFIFAGELSKGRRLKSLGFVKRVLKKTSSTSRRRASNVGEFYPHPEERCFAIEVH